METASVPKFKMPPPCWVVELLEIVELEMVRMPMFPAPPPVFAELPEIVELVKVAVPEL